MRIFLGIIVLSIFTIQSAISRLPEADKQISSYINSTLFGEVLITGEIGKRKIYLKTEDEPQKVLIDEEAMIKDIMSLPMSEEEKAKLVTEAKIAFGDFPKAISETGKMVSTSHNKVITDFASTGNGQDILNGPECDGENKYFDNPEDRQEKAERSSFSMPVSKGFFNYINGKHQGPMSLGKLISVSAKLNTLNDNPLHGGAMAMGLTEFNEGLEGDDRGLTFGMNQELKAEFENGSISLAFFSNLYSRLSARQDGNRFTSYDSETGHYFAENLVHEGITVSFEKNQENGYFMRLEGEISRIDDLKGLALDAQEMWHDQWEANTIIYERLYGKGSLTANYYGFDASIYHNQDTNSARVTGFETGYTFNREGRH